ncbi:MAG: ABC transporter ATP-binding protein [Clostridia bacterium]|jgi:lipopolysaccharide transport system ATP-binding protein/teichoic acid transport system ATP-binding protein|nr:ABC transporter ATP-binding protein [Clostridia bacterium]
MAEPIISVTNLVKIYRIYDKPIDRLKESISITKKKYSKEFYALHNVSFNVQRGENVGIIGTNGSGKSTLLKIITGVLNPTAGEVKVNGKVSALLELGAGFNPEYTGIENIYLNGTMMGLSRSEIDNKLDEILSFAGIGDFINQPVKTYSSGMFARLAFAVAVNVEPEILIVDETLSVGDVRFQIKCMNKMKQMMQGGTTVLFVSHDTNAIKRFCSRAIWLNKGIIMDDGDVNLITDKYLDFLKMGETNINYNNSKENFGGKEIPFVPGDNLAEIVAFHMKNHNGEEVSEIKLDESITVEVIYDVYDETVYKPVIGVAVRSMDDDYVCGLNTMLDNVKIPWKYGRNKISIKYVNGLLAVGGKYYFDVAIMDETASVNIDYKKIIKEFIITSSYVGEGRYVIPHEWRK